MAWQPEPQQLHQLAQCLRDSLSGHDAGAQKKAELMLRQAKGSPDINNYLVYLCITPESNTGLSGESYHAARSAAAIMLKNNVKASFRKIPVESQTYLKANVQQGLQDRNPQIRNYIGNVITEVVRQGGILGWPRILPDLVTVVANEGGGASAEAQDGAMGALFKICEDNRKALDQEYQSQRPLAFLLPKLLDFTHSTSSKIRSKALAAVNVFLVEPVAVTVKEHVNEILPAVVRLSQDESVDVRRFVCRAFALLVDAIPQVLLPHVEGIVDYTISQQKDIHNQELALDAAEFFFEASSNAALREALGSHLTKVVPVLLDSMVYAEDDQLRLEGDEEDADVDDDLEDIKPAFAKEKTAHRDAMGGSSVTRANGEAKPAANGYAYADDDLSDGEIEEDEDFEDIDPEEEWNLRKCSAAALDSLAGHFHGRVFQEVLPWLHVNIEHKDWPNREAAVLALGAIGPGCMDDIKPHLAKLIPYMLTLLSDEQPVVRQITCWSLSRYAQWAAHDDSAPKNQFFEPMMEGLLNRMLDNNKKVQESAASAFAALEEKADVQLAPYCNVILQQFVKCFNKYKDKNMYILYDCVQTLAEHASPSLAQPENVNLLMPAMIVRWETVNDQSREMFPLLECLSFVATALGTEFAPYAPPLFMRCIRLIQQNLEEAEQAYLELPDKDFLVTSLDLLSSIIQALNESQSTELATTAQPNMFQLIGFCMRDVNDDVKQSAYALLGDCAIYIFPQLQPFLPDVMTILINQLDINEPTEDPETAFRVVNNACWSCGEIAMRQKEGMSPYVDPLLAKLATIMFAKDVPDSLNENAAIALGRLGIGCHQQLAPHLAGFAPPFLQSMQKVGWTDEKGHAYKGFVSVVLDNPTALEACLRDFFGEMARAPGVFLTGMQDDGPLSGFERVLAQYKQLIGEGFDKFLASLPPMQEQAIRQLYTF